MVSKNLLTDIKRLHRRLNGCTIEYNLKRYYDIFYKIERIKQKLENKSDSELKNLSLRLTSIAKKNGNLNDLFVDAFALCGETIRRVLQIVPFEEQIIGGIAMHQGKLAEMQTGEGKTLTAVFPVYLNALTGKGVHVLTFNDYLARRDAQWMGPVYQFLGLSVGYIREGMSIDERKSAYNCDITYLTAKESGFDYLRDNLCYDGKNIVHRELNFALIDEADSILIDEVRIPLVIAEADEELVDNPFYMAQVSRMLEPNKDFEFDEYARNIHFTDIGIDRIENILKCDNLFDETNTEILSRLNCALHAEHLLLRDVDYIVREEKIELVDEFTGRIADKRRWPDGLQAAIEAKENIANQSKGKILNSITLQHFVQLYPRICGMTATAQQAENEFKQFYGLDIVVIPPHSPCVRIDHNDRIFPDKKTKLEELVDEIIKVHKTERPILVGTSSVRESAMLADFLRNNNINCEILNAKNDECEAEIISQAGKLGAVTISTNMAGRGTDIRLGDDNVDERKKVAALGGLYVIGTNKHESRRIDYQLKGRAGRQGDPGSSRFFVSLEDDLFVRYKLKDLLPKSFFNNLSESNINNHIVIIEINRVQRIIEGQNFEIKKTLYKYSALIEQQRKIIFQKRNYILLGNFAEEFFMLGSREKYDYLLKNLSQERMKELCILLALFHIDKFWSLYLSEIAYMREGIHLNRYAGQDPFLIFQKMSIEIFDKLQADSETEMMESFNKIDITDNSINFNNNSIKAPSSTWTYLINDNPFEDSFGLQLMGGNALIVGGSMVGFLLLFYPLLKKLGKKAGKNNDD